MPYLMSNSGKGLLGAVALTLGALGAAQFAFGQDFAGTLQASISASNDDANRAASHYDVNRVGKTDRAPRQTNSPSSTQTISVELSGLTDTSVVVRLPLPQARRSLAPMTTPFLTTSSPKRLAVGCEPIVSVLTEIAKQLQPGRCVT
jgi:hypothetical protein